MHKASRKFLPAILQARIFLHKYFMFHQAAFCGYMLESPYFIRPARNVISISYGDSKPYYLLAFALTTRR